MIPKRVLCLVTIIGALALSAPAKALADCDSKVVDEAGALTADDRSAVDAVARDLGDLGADVRVRTVTDLGGYPTIDAYEDSLRKACGSWKGQDGLTKNNLVVVIFSYGAKRGAALYYGKLWHAQLDDRWVGLAASLKPLLRSGQNRQAFVAALGGVAGFIRTAPPATTYVAPPPPPQPPVVATAAPTFERSVPIDPPVRSAPPTTVPSTSATTPPPSTNVQPPVTVPPVSSSSTSLTFLWIVLGAILVVGIGIVAFMLLRARKRDRKIRQEARKRAMDAKSACEDRIGDFDSGTKLALAEERMKAAAGEVSDEDAQPIRAAFVDLKAKLDSAKEEFLGLRGADEDPSADDRSPEAYERAAVSYRALLEKLDAFDAAIPALDAAIAKLSDLAGEVPAKIAAATKAIAEAEAARADVSGLKYAIAESDKRIAEAKASLASAETARAEKRFAAAAGSAEKAKTLSGEAAKLAADVPVRRQKALETAAALEARVPAVASGIGPARAVFEEISGAYAKTCWETVRGNGSSAEGEIAEAGRAVEAAKQSASMEVQDWSGAEQSLGAARASLDRAESLVRSIHALKTRLETIRREAPGEIEEARGDLVRAREYVLKYDADIRESLETDLDKVETDIAAAAGMLKGDKPDYLEVTAKTKAAHAKIDSIYGQARTEHEAMERKRKLAASGTRDAEAMVSKTKEYLEDHARDVGGSLSSALASAELTLANAKKKAAGIGGVVQLAGESEKDGTANRELDEVIRFVGESESAAKAVLESAQSAVRRAEAERARIEAERLARIEAERQARLEEDRRAEQARQRRFEEERRAADARQDRLDQERRNREEADRRARERELSFRPPPSFPSSLGGSHAPSSDAGRSSPAPASPPDNGGGGSVDW